jgi:hypothetical protein
VALPFPTSSVPLDEAAGNAADGPRGPAGRPQAASLACQLSSDVYSILAFIQGQSEYRIFAVGIESFEPSEWINQAQAR